MTGLGRLTRSRVIVAAVAAVVLAGCSESADGIAGTGTPPPTPSTPRTLSILRDGTTVASFAVEVADSPAERAVGLMGRTDLADGTGMAFLFDRPEAVRFWMKDTLIPLSIAFWDASGTIVAILDMEPCTSEPCPTYGPGVPVIGALEVAAGAFTDAAVAVGDRVVLNEA